MTAQLRPPLPTARRPGAPDRAPWVVLVVMLGLALLWFALSLYVVRDPLRRRKVLNTAGRNWLRIEAAAEATGRRLRTAHHRREEHVRRIARELWDAVDDLPHVVRR